MRISKQTIRDLALIVCLGSFFFIPFLGSVRLFDWDEINFAEAAREMIVTGNYTRVQINYQPFWEKPPLFIWLQVISMKMLGVTEFAARFVNAVCGILTLVTVYLVGKRLYDRRFGLIWALAFLGSFFPYVFFKSGSIDPVFNLFIFAGIYFMSRIADYEERNRHYIVAGVFIGLAILTKGPVAFLVAGLCIVTYWFIHRRQEPFTVKRMLLFCSVAGAVAALWFGPETVLNGTWFIREFIRYHLRLLTTGDAGHGRPFYFHFIAVFLGCFPASILALRVFFAKPGENFTQRNFKQWMLILFWVVMILFSLVKTKTVLYSSLAYYPITFLAAYHLYNVVSGKLSWTRGQTVLLAGMAVIIAAAIIFFPVLVMQKDILISLIKDKHARACLERPVPFNGYEFLIGVGYALGLAASIFFFIKRRILPGLVLLFLSSAVCLQVYTRVLLPKAEKFTQAGPIAFYHSLQGRDCYLKVLFKTYADLFYGRKMPPANSASYDKKWLLEGAIDKPVYFVSRNTQLNKYREQYRLPVLKEEYGFVYYFREVPGDTVRLNIE